MVNLSSIAQSGLQAAQARLNASASNVANLQTPGYKPVTVQAQAQQQGGVVVNFSRAATDGVAMEEEAVAQIQAKTDFMANLQVLKTADQVMGSLLDTKA